MIQRLPPFLYRLYSEDMRYKHFTKDERCEIAILLKKGFSIREIAYALDRSPSSVSREIVRTSVTGRYVARKAKHKAYVRRKYSKYQGMKVRSYSDLESYVAEHIKPPWSWSPEQIAGRWNSDYPEMITITARGIYKYLYSMCGQKLCQYLTYKRYYPKQRKQAKSVKELIPNRVWIDERPRVANERTRFGDFEGDTMGRPRWASQETLVVVRERLSRKMFAVKIPRLKYTIEGFKRILDPSLVKTFTLDNGVENVRYGELGVDTYFCHPYSSWEKGTVENGIGLIRDYIPKKSDLGNYTQEEIDAMLKTINSKPMKLHGWKTPNEVFEEQLSLTGVLHLRV